MSTKVAVVTGSNKGVGFAIVRALCKQFDGDVILTSRDEGRGQAAIKELEKEGLKPKFHQLDIEDHESIVRLGDFIKKTYGGLDILVNNAGIAYKGASTAPFSEQAVVTNKCNFFATLDVCNTLFPLLRPHARVSNVSSMVSQSSLAKCSQKMQSRFVDPNITMEELESIIKEFVSSAQDGKHQDHGFSNSSYGMSKVGVTVMSIIQQRELDKQGAEDIVVNAVTGSNKGIGFGIVRALCRQFDGDVILTSRDEGRGQAAIRELEKEGLKPKFHQLDIEDHESIVRLGDFIKKTYGGLDVLVNNAAIKFKRGSTTPASEQTVLTMKCNFFSTFDVCNTLFPLLRAHARVCNVSTIKSQWCLANNKLSEKWQTRFMDPDITMEELESIVKEFVSLVQNGTHQENGFFLSPYEMSKVGVTVMSMIQQRELDKQGAEDIVVNACCPGHVATDMSSHTGDRTIDQGAENPMYCVMLPANIDSPRGKLIQQKRIVPWKPSA